MLASASRRDSTIVARHEVPGKASSNEPSRRVRYDQAQLVSDTVCDAANRCAHLCESHRSLRHGSFRAAIPGTSCPATIASSLWGLSDMAYSSLADLYRYLWLQIRRRRRQRQSKQGSRVVTAPRQMTARKYANNASFEPLLSPFRLACGS